jgi:uncharacterized membrane protein YfcA
MWISLVSAGTGILSGLAVGGGSLLVPILVLLFRIAQHRAQGAVLLALLAITGVGALTHWRHGHVRKDC